MYECSPRFLVLFALVLAGTTAVDLFAGPGGWGEALRLLGVRALGIDTDTDACATARAAGHERLQRDVSVLDPSRFGEQVDGLVGSPPCQALSQMGKRLGLGDMAHVVACARELAAGHDRRAEFAPLCEDPRSLLIVEPLRWALALQPRWIALEQVPAAIAVYELFAELLGDMGWDATAVTLHAEEYGVPQTRKRAFLLATKDGYVEVPEPTHQRFVKGVGPDPASPLPPPLSMADVLPIPDHWTLRPNRRTRSVERAATEPSVTITAGHDALDRVWIDGGHEVRRVTADEAAVLQGFSPGYPWHGGSLRRQFAQIGNAVPPPLGERVLSALHARQLSDRLTA